MIAISLITSYIMENILKLIKFSSISKAILIKTYLWESLKLLGPKIIPAVS